VKRTLAIWIVLGLAMLTLAVVGPYLFINDLFIVVNKPTGVTRVMSGGDLFHVVPENSLQNDGVVTLESTKGRHYVLSEEQLRLIGPKFLAKLAEDQ
jgi:hypothetical protein